MKFKKSRAAVILIIVVLFVFPWSIAKAAPAENYQLSGWDLQQQKWTPGNLSGYTELDWVPFRLEVRNYAGNATEICYMHDYEKQGTSGYADSRNFYIGDEQGTQLFSLQDGVFSISGPSFDTDNGGVMIMEYCFNLLDTPALINLNTTFYLYWESQLAGPHEASAWSGASLHTAASVTGAQTVPINVQKINPLLTAALELTKTASTSMVNPGDTVTYAFVVSNNGDYPYDDVVITDPMLGTAFSHSVGALPVGASTAFTVDYVIPADSPAGPLINTATAIGAYSGGTKSASDDETLVIQTVTAETPSIDIHKTVDRVEAEPGDTVTYSFHVTNTGNADLVNVVITDPLFGVTWSHVIGSMHAGEIVWYDAEYTVPESAESGVIVNTALVTGDYSGGQVSDNADASVNVKTDSPPALTAGIELTKRVDDESLNPGDTAKYHFTVKNTGTYTLTSITVTDPLFGSGWAYPIDILEPGSSVSFDHDYDISPDHDPGIIENIATVSALYEGGTVTDTTSETISVVAIPPSGQPSLHIDKTADAIMVTPGATITYSIHVTNDGNVDITDVVLTDHLLGDTWSYNFGKLDVGETRQYQYIFTVPLGTLAGNLKNVASVTGQAGNVSISKSDDAIVYVDAPPPYVANLVLTSLCSDNPDQTRRWKITNTNHSDIVVDWVLQESGESGTTVVQGDTDVYLETETYMGVNTLRVTYLDGREETKVSSGLACQGTQLQLITIHSMCVASPQSNRIEWQINNPNDYDVKADWEVENKAGTTTLVPGINILYTDEIKGTPNTLSLYIDGRLYASESRACYKDIDLSALCALNPEDNLRWSLTNDNAYAVDVTWLLVGSVPLQTGTVTAQPGVNYFYTNTISGNNVVAIFVDDILQRNGSVQSLKLQCPTQELPLVLDEETAVLAEKDVDLGEDVEPSLPDGTILKEDILGATEELPQTGGIYLWYLYLPGFALITVGAVSLLKVKQKKYQKT